MTELMRGPWSIFDDLVSLEQDFDRLAQEQWLAKARTAYPPMNVWASEEQLVIDAELPGVDPKQVEIAVQGDQLSLSGEVKGDAQAAGETYHRRERAAGNFSRYLQLPFKADTGKIKATYRNGILRISVVRAEEDKPRQIAIQAA